MVLISSEDIGSALNKACKHDADNDAIHLARAAKVVRRHVQNEKPAHWFI